MAVDDDIARGPGRPRDPQVDDAILEATVMVLRARGWAGTTIEEVATRAGVGKTSIYRRYPSKIALVADAAAHDRDTRFPGFDTGTFVGDLTSFVLGSLRMLLESVWHRVLPGILAEAADDPAVSEVVQGYWTWRRDSIRDIVERGIARGEVEPGTEAEQVLDAVDGPILLRLLLTKAPLDYGFADRLVDHVLRAVGSSLG